MIGATPSPVIGVLCCNEVAGRAVQVVASRFVEPLATIAGATVLLVPALTAVTDPAAVVPLLDGLLLTGSRSHVAPSRYRSDVTAPPDQVDEQRDEVALRLAERMIEAGKPVFGICRGMQELNVLFGGTLTDDAAGRGHHGGSWEDGYDRLFEHRHDVDLTGGGVLERITGAGRLSVSSVHQQGVDRLGSGLKVEAVATHDSLVEAFGGTACGAEVLAVQWHPECDVGNSPASRAFFAHVGDSARRARAVTPAIRTPRPLTGGRYVGH
ncbi:gamma-glutamyl-gamma-aminobutyrate hydrolase [Sphingomonas gellani]|uniref:Gamma-glutamyl-gamma-aminobutyrate hydrolase n=1 Tax=Sphingomonas gellani TaxID=1166340 RepID=A0A1H8DXD0_9SPHN|nr:gamma-glutamyl-gamma-aminobutyrate hydrolase family protein [Sphingomonas gellani]SEN11816.1 gamma-glutamyl-gamma-aminobutyrate hydrolase [Sphingomonas gellani]